MKCERVKVVVRGAVQGVGFRPFVYRLATELQLHGWVLNSAQGVFIEVEGARDLLQRFVLRLEMEKPARAVIQSCESSFLDLIGYDSFEIRESDKSGQKTALVLPDIATCADCRREIFDPHDRRFRYSFTNCTNCGPRFSIIEGLPYDRANTSMKHFAMCAECEREYLDPTNRRFHAEPIACPRCGPQLRLWDEAGTELAYAHEALLKSAKILRAGRILALKGVGGFQLTVDARNEDAIARLRARKHREEKPFAVMYPSVATVREDCEVSEMEERLLLSPESPIVLLRTRKLAPSICQSVAPANPNLGVMLPYSPLHHLLLSELDFPIVATSGNLSDEPICIDEHDALKRLHGIADFFLVHNRPIVRQVDDSVGRIMHGRESVMRRARGYAPLPIQLKETLPTILAVGAHLKNTVALSVGSQIFVSQHIGDLETKEAYSAFRKVAADLPLFYDAKIDIVACDLHKDYLSTKYAAELPAPTSGVQHHWAHVACCMAENELEPPVLGISWDGTGLGLDGTIWGGEFLLANEQSFTRVAHLRQFRLPGGDTAIKEPRRCALGLLHEIFGDDLWKRHDFMSIFSRQEVSLLRQLLEKEINAPITSSAGRLFDAVSSLIGLRSRSNFEGQAAMELEFAIRPGIGEAYPFELKDEGPSCIVDWEPMILALLDDIANHNGVGVMAAKFHNMLTESIVAIARKIEEPKIVLTGGCFQNRYLTERTIDRLIAENFRPYWHQRVPPNDGGIALGQVAAAARSRTAVA
jgi:hydrogenase maturation protein HypF